MALVISEVKSINLLHSQQTVLYYFLRFLVALKYTGLFLRHPFNQILHSLRYTDP